MKSHFIEELNLTEQLRDKLSLFSAKIKEIDGERHIELFLETSDQLSVEDVSELIKKLSLLLSVEPYKGKLRIRVSDIHILNNKRATKDYELYMFVRYLLSQFTSINNSRYFVEIEDENNAVIYLSKESLVPEIKKLLSNIKIFLSNFGIYKGNLEVKYDLSKFNYEFFKQKRDGVFDEMKLLENPKPHPDYELVKPFLARQGIDKAYFEGKVFMADKRVTKNGWTITEFKVAKGFEALTVISFADRRNPKDIPVAKGDYVRFYGVLKWNDFSKEYQLTYSDHEQLDESLEVVKFKEHIPERRAEFRVHTKMSTMDGVGSVAEYINSAKEYGLKGIAITDKNSLQSYPDAAYMDNDENFKVVYGLELDTYDDKRTSIAENVDNTTIKGSTYVYFDLETTGISPLVNEIIEFGAVKVQNGNIVSTKQLFIKPTIEIPEQTTQLTGITQQDVEGAPAIKEGLEEILEYLGDAILVAHNAEFDMTFLNSHLERNGFDRLTNPVVDSMKLSWAINKNIRNHRLGTIARAEHINYDESVAHRADYDAEVLEKTFENMILRLLDMEFQTWDQVNEKLNPEIINNIFALPVTILAKNQQGLKDIFKIMSDANVKYFNTRTKQPFFPLSELLNRRENLLIGSACSKGYAFKYITQDQKDKDEIISMFDYIEIFPLSVYGGEIAKGFYSREEMKQVLLKLEEVAVKNNVPVIAAGDVYYNKKDEKLLRDVYISAKGLGGKLHPLYMRNNPKYIKPDQYLRPTSAMLGSMNRIFDDEEKAMKYAVDNTLELLDQIEKVKPLKDKLYTPSLPEGDEFFLNLVKQRTEELYGDNPPELIKERIEKEINSITKHGFSVIYYLSSLAVRKSLEDGYLVGSRGSVGSSIAATLSDITEVNPLQPHWRCEKCKHVEFNDVAGSGYDLEDKPCPVCGTTMKGDGHDIPFETFLGFEGDKVPDIDLNFSGEYQPVIHNYIKEFLGADKVFRAGTISTVAEKTAYGYLLNYFEVMEEEAPSRTNMEYLANRVKGTKRTTGQHPGGLIVVPQDLDIEDFSPINYPGNDANSEWLTTHFDFHSIHDNLLKLDFLGHIDPSAIKMLEDITGIDSRKDIPMNDQEVLSLFESNKALNIKEKILDEELGILGIPEFGTKFVRELVADAKPESFADLVRISGLSHGTDVWLGNAKDLIDQGLAKLKDVISVRDDIMTYLIKHELDNKMSFNIMESVRKGKGLTPEWETAMREHDVPEWYIESCKKIKYMFPKAHATAYVMMAFRIAWYKINHPLAYYATFFSKRDTEWDLNILYQEPKEILKYIKDVESKSKWETTDKEKMTVQTLYIVLEMYSRGFKIQDISLEKSLATDWKVDLETNSLIPPFNVLEGLGDSAAKTCVEAREEKMFTSIEDFNARSGINKTLRERMRDIGILKDLKAEQNSNEQSIFDFTK